MAQRGTAMWKALASNRQLWRLNADGCLQIREQRGEPIGRDTAKALMSELVSSGLVQTEPHKGKR